jgi:hypothetical protein
MRSITAFDEATDTTSVRNSFAIGTIVLWIVRAQDDFELRFRLGAHTAQHLIACISRSPPNVRSGAKASFMSQVRGI